MREDLPFDVKITSGTVKIDAESIFLRNITSTRIERCFADWQVTWQSLVVLLLAVIVGIAILVRSGGDQMLVAIGIWIAGIIGMAVSRRVVLIYDLVIVTAAGEVRVLRTENKSELIIIESAITKAVDALDIHGA